MMAVGKTLTSDRTDIPGQVMITSKITSKAQTTIPQPVRAAVRVGEGDEIAYRIEGDHVILTKAKREPVDDPSPLYMSGRPKPIGAPMASFEV